MFFPVPSDDRTWQEEDSSSSFSFSSAASSSQASASASSAAPQPPVVLLFLYSLEFHHTVESGELPRKIEQALRAREGKGGREYIAAVGTVQVEQRQTSASAIAALPAATA